MNWDNLHHFVVLAREGTTGRASEVLEVHHTTVARRITALEEELKTQLFDRHPGGYALTPSGQDILTLAQEMERLTQTIEQKVYGQDAALQGTLRLTMHNDLANTLVISELHRFLRRYPGIDLELRTTAAFLDLNTREADIALRLTSAPSPHLIGRRVAPLVRGLYASPVYLELARPPHNVLLYRSEESPAWMAQHFPGARVILRWDDLSTAHRAVASGLGVAALPCFYADAHPGLRRLRLEMPEPDRYLWILTHANLKTSARVQACKAFLTEVLEERRELILGRTSIYGQLLHTQDT